MLTLGVESTAHTFGIGVFDGKKCLANEKVMYTGEGIHPMKASQFLCDNASSVVSAALKKSRKKISDFELVAFARGPGIGPCLRVGSVVARSIAKTHSIPLIGVNHCVAHIEVGKWSANFKDPLVVYVSGANTQILGLAGGKYRVYGETLDTGLGNALDSFGRAHGMLFPAGPKVEKMALKGKKFLELPYSVKGMDLAFSGLVTAASRKKLSADLVFSFQETIFGMLVEVAERALAHTKKKELMLVGGVAQNERLCDMLKMMSKEHGAKFSVPEKQFNADNAFMIALLGAREYAAGVRDESNVDQKWRTDNVEVTW